MIIGECIDGIGDIELHKPVKRTDANGRETYRTKGNTLGYYMNETDAELVAHPPLWKPMDFRTVERILFAGKRSSEKMGNTQEEAYHFHNLFTTLDDLKFKYKTHSHGEADALTKLLGKLQPDIDWQCDVP